MSTPSLRWVAAVLALIVAQALPAQQGSSEVDELVLVAAHQSPITPLSPVELRLAYLAVPVQHGDLRIKPVVNRSNALLYEAFLQKVIFLSSQHYERQLVSHVFKSGGTRPPFVDREKLLVDMLVRDEQHVAIMWRSDAERHPELRAVQTIWKGRTE